jgi:hypothetical protein
MHRTITVALAYALFVIGTFAQGLIGHYRSVVGETLELKSDSTYQYVQYPTFNRSRLSNGAWSMDGDSLKLRIDPEWEREYDGPIEYFHRNHFLVRGKRLYYTINGDIRENWYYRKVRHKKRS